MAFEVGAGTCLIFDVRCPHLIERQIDPVEISRRTCILTVDFLRLVRHVVARNFLGACASWAMESLPSAKFAFLAAATRGVSAFGTVVVGTDHSMVLSPLTLLARPRTAVVQFCSQIARWP